MAIPLLHALLFVFKPCVLPLNMPTQAIDIHKQSGCIEATTVKLTPNLAELRWVDKYLLKMLFISLVLFKSEEVFSPCNIFVYSEPTGLRNDLGLCASA